MLDELRAKAESMRAGLDAKYTASAPVPWDMNRKDRTIRFNQQFELAMDDGSVVRIEQQDVEQDIGSCVWTCAIAMSKYLEHHYRGGALSQAQVIELGSGTGLVGIVAARMGAHVVLTDLGRVVPRLELNIGLNALTDEHGRLLTEAGGVLTASELMWGVTSLDRFMDREEYQLILACEVIYESDMVQPLLDTLEALASAQTEVLLGYCLLYTSDAADEEDSVDLGGRRIIKKKKNKVRKK
eukprot:TRINITY_DN50733_c0_g1_i1.p1 TRINITY_DN50733_c0_g1~~TRINITY_DN50733_c0_g1_i1.p1  ORF type:complete len:241 (+),score=71.34 TRINITY_DN50733_c0_g1_i1:204-926(+)